MLYDAHNHLQKLAGRADFAATVAAARAAGVGRMVVNGTHPDDWAAVAALARAYPDLVVPAFGLHPWELDRRGPEWLATLAGYLEAFPTAIVGEIGLDRWVHGHDPVAQEAVFLAQWRLAVDLDRPAQVHCLKAFGALDALLAKERAPTRGWLLHSYGGPAAMVPGWVRRGASFSFSGYFLQPRKREGRAEAFRAVPDERLLIETDAPDMAPPPELGGETLVDGERTLNPPANLRVVATGLAGLLGREPEALAALTTANALRCFG